MLAAIKTVAPVAVALVRVRSLRARSGVQYYRGSNRPLQNNLQPPHKLGTWAEALDLLGYSRTYLNEARS
jgi:hypothetical protein